MQHLDEGTIHAWLDGALPPLEAEQVAKHAAECATCAAAVAEARGIIAGSARIVSALDDVPGGVIPSGGRTTAPVAGTPLWRRLRLTPGRAALAATILLAVSATLTVRFSNSPAAKRGNTSMNVAASKPLQATPAPPKAAPASMPITIDSFKVPGPSSRLVSASVDRRSDVVVQVPRPQPVAEQRQVADAPTPRDTSTRELQKVRATAQEAVAGASAASAPTAAPSMKANANAIGSVRALATSDSVGTFEGCYRLSADSSAGSTEIPQGLPASFVLSRPSADSRALPRRFADVRADSAGVPVTWQQLSTTQANVTFAAGSTRQVSLTLTAGSPVGVASSGNRTTTVRVMRSTCPR